MAARPTKAPTLQSNPISGAKAEVTQYRECDSPRSVFEGLNSGLPSRNSALPSTGVAKVFPRILAAITGVPLATARSARSGQ